jgi:hypothetical protein
MLFFFLLNLMTLESIFGGGWKEFFPTSKSGSISKQYWEKTETTE